MWGLEDAIHELNERIAELEGELRGWQGAFDTDQARIAELEGDVQVYEVAIEGLVARIDELEAATATDYAVMAARIAEHHFDGDQAYIAELKQDLDGAETHVVELQADHSFLSTRITELEAQLQDALQEAASARLALEEDA